MQETDKSGQKSDSDIDGTTRFFANALHEIRTPIQTIIGAAERIQTTLLDKEQKEYDLHHREPELQRFIMRLFP